MNLNNHTWGDFAVVNFAPLTVHPLCHLLAYFLFGSVGKIVYNFVVTLPPSSTVLSFYFSFGITSV